MARGTGILEAIDKTDTLRVRSPLSTWLRKNHDAFAARLSERVADWSVLVGLFADAGLTDRYGNPPKAETARKTWQRVRKEVAAARAKPQPPGAAARRPEPKHSSATIAASPPGGGTKAPSDDLLRVMAEMGARGNKLTEPLE